MGGVAVIEVGKRGRYCWGSGSVLLGLGVRADGVAWQGWGAPPTRAWRGSGQLTGVRTTRKRGGPQARLRWLTALPPSSKLSIRKKQISGYGINTAKLSRRLT